MPFRVDLSEQAQADLSTILEWLISQDAGETGLRWFRGFEGAIASLAEMPHRCPLAPEDRSFPFQVRHLLYGKKPHVYRAIFTISEDFVYVIRVLQGRREHLN